ncbi:hypothetical protein Drorol1_Dr00008041 [Drosera rotundifolia]
MGKKLHKGTSPKCPTKITIFTLASSSQDNTTPSQLGPPFWLNPRQPHLQKTHQHLSTTNTNTTTLTHTPFARSISLLRFFIPCHISLIKIWMPISSRGLIAFESLGELNLSMMELNARSPFYWDWDHLVMLNQKPMDEVPKKMLVVDSELEAMEEGYAVGSFQSSEGRSEGAGSGIFQSALGYGSSSKSSKSASVDSAMDLEAKESRFLSENNDGTRYELSFKKELHTAGSGKMCAMAETSAGPKDSMLGLKLGRRTYFEDVSAGGNAKMSALVHTPVASTARRSRLSSLNVVVPHCQVDGCHLDLSSAKDYHRKHKVCETHSKSPKVTVAGQERRFCQQCSRFHSLPEFDQKKKSCRKRLADHNARRRKPKPNVMHFGSIRPPSSLYGTCFNLQSEARHQMAIAFDQVQSVHIKSESSNAKFAPAKFGLFTSTNDGLLDPDIKLCHNPQQFLSSKGMQAHMHSSSMDATAQDLRALSLLSSNSWGSTDSEAASLNAIKVTQPSSLPMVDAAVSMLLPASSAGYWHAGQSIGTNSHFGKSSSSHQEFQLFKDPQEPSFYLY